MADAGIDVRDADLLVGTSAGARVAVDLTSGDALEAIYQRRAQPTGAKPETPAAIDWGRIRATVDAARSAGGRPADILRQYGALASEVAIGSVASRRQTVAAQLPTVEWPRQRILIPAVSAESGERRAFDRDSGIDLVDAIMATTTSFGAPPVPFDGQHYIDGGYYSSDNADLAIGFERVLILALRSPPQAMRLVPIEDSVQALRSAGSLVEVIHPDEETMAALSATGGQMNPASGRPAAIAGRLQGQRTIDRIASFWR
jgi:NTE family protein